MRRAVLLLVPFLLIPSTRAAEPLPGTKPLTRDGDLAAQMVEGIDKYLMGELAASVEHRKAYWKPDYSSPAAYQKSIQANRDRLKKMLGVVEARVPFTDLDYVSSTNSPALVAQTKDYKVFAVRWPVLPDVEGDGLLLEPTGKVVASVVAIPDADWTPEMLVGLAAGVPEKSQYARRLAELGCRVLIPTLIDRKDTYSGNPALGRMTNQPGREFIYRMAYEMGRHIIGYEVQKILAAVDWFAREKNHPPIGVMGYGEGGLLALYAAAGDDGVTADERPRIRTVVVSGYFGPREGVWKEPIYRNVFGLLKEFGDENLVQLVAYEREFVVEKCPVPKIDGPPKPAQGRTGAAPGKLETPDRDSDAEMLKRLDKLPGGKKPGWVTWNELMGPGQHLDLVFYFAGEPRNTRDLLREPKSSEPIPKDARKDFDPAPRQKRQFDQLVAFTQKLLRDSDLRRQETFWNKLDYSSPANYSKSVEPFRKQLWEEVIGKLPAPTEEMNPRTRQIYDNPKFTGYEVTLDLYPDVFAYGILLLPKDMKSGDKRPVVVCQHGLEGRPNKVVDPKDTTNPYHAFGAQLAERGYIVYAPQNPYIGQDKFRVLQRKANPLGLSLFSFIVRQHERTLDWLATLPNVDAERMGFYGLSYGGKTAMRVPALLPRYCLSICSGDFNEWVAKNASVDFRGSYMFSNEYEMPEFNLGHTFNYAEMAALIAPRPFMVERGHDDGVGIDEMVALEYAKVRRLYSKLKLPEKTEIEFFAGVHEIHGEGTFRFLDKHLK
jgi:dienelactone hydrolase